MLGDLPSKVQELTQNEDNVKLSLQNKENELKETEQLFDQDINEEEDFEIPAFLRKQKF